MATQNIADLIQFNTACEDFIAGRYILADVKIASILKIIETDEKLKDIMASCLNNFNFDYVFENSSKAVENGYELTLPMDEKKLVAFVYTLLYRFHTGNINFYEFISSYYKTEDDTTGKEFYSFANAVIIPFQQAIGNLYSKRHVIVEADDYQKNYYNKIMSTIRLILKNVDTYKLKMNEKEEFTMLLNSLYLASEKNDKKLVFSLMIALDYFTRCNKKCRVAYLTLEECFTN